MLKTWSFFSSLGIAFSSLVLHNTIVQCKNSYYWQGLDHHSHTKSENSAFFFFPLNLEHSKCLKIGWRSRWTFLSKEWSISWIELSYLCWNASGDFIWFTKTCWIFLSSSFLQLEGWETPNSLKNLIFFWSIRLTSCFSSFCNSQFSSPPLVTREKLLSVRRIS